MAINKNRANPDAPLALERMPSVQARTGLSRSELYRRMAVGKFPRPAKLGARASAWNVEEVDRWIADHLAARDRKEGP